MNYIFFVLLRRLRAPLITVVVVYAISILGFVLIPGVDDQGNPWRMDFFHAFYFVSFMGSTIGFGEIPYPFTSAQRLWTLVTLYATVISWLYSIGRMLAILQEQAFTRQMKRIGFHRQVKRIGEPFYLVCGYGMTGSRVVSKLSLRGIHSVVIDINRDRIDALETDDLIFDLPGLCADAAQPDILQCAGLESKHCIGVLALTDNDSANLAIAIAAKLLSPKVPVICRSASELTTANLASFGTDHIIDPFVTYSKYLAMAIESPYQHLVHDWLTNPRHRKLSSANERTSGHWVICGYGRFGHALQEAFQQTDVDITIIDPNPQTLDSAIPFIQGLGTDAASLREAGIEQAVGLVAGTDNDGNNLSIIMTALELNPHVFSVARQNLNFNGPVFEAARCDLIMEPSRIVANDILNLLKSPLLKDFLEQMRLQKDEAWARELVHYLNLLIGDQELDSWSIALGGEESVAISRRLQSGEELALGVLLRDPAHLDESLKAYPLMLKRAGRFELLPDPTEILQANDEILFCGAVDSLSIMRWTAANDNVLAQVNREPGADGGALARWWRRRQQA